MKAKLIPTGMYVTAWALLMAGFGATLALANINLHGWNVPVAILIALAQMMIVIVYYMHVRHTPRLTWVFVMTGFYWLCILLILGLADYISRGWLRP